MPESLIFGIGEVQHLKRFMEKATGCQMQKVPDRMVLDGGGVEFFVELINAVAEKHHCGNHYQLCELCETREALERRLLAVSR